MGLIEPCVVCRELPVLSELGEKRLVLSPCVGLSMCCACLGMGNTEFLSLVTYFCLNLTLRPPFYFKLTQMNPNSLKTSKPSLIPFRLDLLLILSSFHRVFPKITSKYQISSPQLFFLITAYHHSEKNFYFTIPAIRDILNADHANTYKWVKTLINTGYIEPYTPQSFNYTGNRGIKPLYGRKRSKRGQLYKLTDKGNNVIRYLMRCYNEIYRETH